VFSITLYCTRCVRKCYYNYRAILIFTLGLGEALVKSSLLPSLVELASDDNMAVRSSAVASAVLIIPYLNKREFKWMIKILMS
jgi:hypothetical protein